MVIMMMVMMMVVISIYCSMQNTWQMPGVATANPFLVFAHFFFLTTTETTQTAAPPAHSPKGREEQSPVETIVAEATQSARFTRGRRRHASSSWFPAFCTFGEISPVRHYTEMASHHPLLTFGPHQPHGAGAPLTPVWLVTEAQRSRVTCPGPRSVKVIEPRRERGWFISDRAAVGRREVVRQLDPGELGVGGTLLPSQKAMNK